MRQPIRPTCWTIAALPLIILLLALRPASAQIAFDVQTNPSIVANTGLSEVLGDLILRANASCGTNSDKQCKTIAGSINVRYNNVTIDNGIATGISICEGIGGNFQCNQAGVLMTGSVTVSGDTVTVAINDGVDIAANDYLVVGGVRARIASSVLVTPGLETQALLSATPPIGASFPSDPQIVTHSAAPLSLLITGVFETPCTSDDGIPTAVISEAYSRAFVDYGDPAGRTFPGLPGAPRPLLGGNANTRVSLKLTGLDPSVRVQWPASIVAQNSPAVLDLVSQSDDGTTAIYIFGTPNQAASDLISEIFAIRLRPINFLFSGSGTLSGIVGLQAQLLPPPLPDNVRPRYDHPFGPVPAAPFFLLKRCVPPVGSTGKSQVHASVDGIQWSGTLNYRLEGPSIVGGSKTPQTLDGLPIGVYTMTHLSGGPAGATFTNITPAAVQNLIAGGTIDFTFNFTGPTIANVGFAATPISACAAATSTVGSFRLVNNTPDQQIIPGGTNLTFDFGKIIVTAPTVTGLGNIQPSSTATSLTYHLSTSLSLTPGDAIEFSGLQLNLNGVSNGQAITALFTPTPAGSIVADRNQVTLATVSSQACVPTLSLTVTPTTIQKGQSATLSWSSQNATQLNIQPGIGPVLAQGSQIVTPTQTTTYTLTGQGTGGPGQVSATLIVTASPTAPAFTATGVTNAASFLNGITAGSLATVFGVRLSNVSGIVGATILPLPPQLAGTFVTLNGITAPMVGVANVNGSEQINFQVPWELAGLSTASMVINNNGDASDPVQVALSPALPGIFTLDGTSGAILHPGSPDVVSPANPATRGEVVLIYATGLGPVTFTPATGAAASGTNLSFTTTTPQVTIGSVPTAPPGAALAPGFVGLYQLNVQIPSTAPSGTQNLVIQMGNQQSKVATIAIQ
jgi:uncharacterized protein (TIGR03437 family)